MYDLFAALVTRLTSYVRQAGAAQGGQVTPEMLFRCTTMINNAWQQIQIARTPLTQVLASMGQSPSSGGGVDWGDVVVGAISLIPWVRVGRTTTGVWRVVRTVLRLRGKTPPPDPVLRPPTLPRPDWPSLVEKAQDKLPDSWGSGEPNRKPVGHRWHGPTNPNIGVWIDQGDPNSSSPSQQVDHVVVNTKSGIVGPDGNPISGPLKQNPQAHIPLSDWLNWKNWNSP